MPGRALVLHLLQDARPAHWLFAPTLQGYFQFAMFLIADYLQCLLAVPYELATNCFGLIVMISDRLDSHPQCVFTRGHRDARGVDTLDSSEHMCTGLCVTVH